MLGMFSALALIVNILHASNLIPKITLQLDSNEGKGHFHQARLYL